MLVAYLIDVLVVSHSSLDISQFPQELRDILCFFCKRQLLQSPDYFTMFGLSCLMLEKNHAALLTWRWLHDIPLHGKVIFGAQISSRPICQFKLHNPKLFFSSARWTAEQLCAHSCGGQRPKDTA